MVLKLAVSAVQQTRQEVEDVGMNIIAVTPNKVYQWLQYLLCDHILPESKALFTKIYLDKYRYHETFLDPHGCTEFCSERKGQNRFEEDGEDRFEAFSCMQSTIASLNRSRTNDVKEFPISLDSSLDADSDSGRLLRLVDWPLTPLGENCISEYNSKHALLRFAWP